MSDSLKEDRIRHLEMLHGAISRMAGAAAAIKSLSLVIAAGALAFLATSKEPWIAFYAALIMVAFWLLDARYLQQEKWFRDMFEDERKDGRDEAASFVMTPSNYIRTKTSIFYGLKSWSTSGLYAPIIVFLLTLCYVLYGADPTPAGGCHHG